MMGVCISMQVAAEARSIGLAVELEFQAFVS